MDDNDDREVAILTAYRKLGSRRVDLVGDYAGNELFVIDGDSMLLRCFSDSKLDFTYGLQLLHAVYNVEAFLHNLIQRKCCFHVVFLESNKHLCVPATVQEENQSKYLFARAVIIRHLITSLPQLHPEIKVSTFDDWRSVDFADYLKTHSPYFLMTHDGAQKVEYENSEQEVTPDEHYNQQKLAFREMIIFLVQRGYNVALVNELDWRDTKVMAVVLETRRQAALASMDMPLQATTQQPEEQHIAMKDFSLSHSDLTERERLAIMVVSKLLQNIVPSTTKEEWTEMCSIFLLHEALITHLPLSSRRLDTVPEDSIASLFLRSVVATAIPLLENLVATSEDISTQGQCDVADLIDGRLFLYLCHNSVQYTSDIERTYKKLLQAVKEVEGTHLQPAGDCESQSRTLANPSQDRPSKDTSVRLSVLPFSSPVFDKHLESVRIRVDAGATNKPTLESRKIFKEVSHWHNAKRPLVQKGPAPTMTSWQVSRAARRNQLFMAEMAVYAASLTNAVGRSLEPETIIVGSTGMSGKPTETPLPQPTSSSKKEAPKKSGGGGKTNAKNARKQDMLDQLAASKAKKVDAADEKVISAWHTVWKGFAVEPDPAARYTKSQIYLQSLQPSWRDIVGPECELYMISCLAQIWVECSRTGQQKQAFHIAALIWNHAQNISQAADLPDSIIKGLGIVVDTLTLPGVRSMQASSKDRKLPFSLNIQARAPGLSISMPSKDFQILHCGPFLERSFDSKADPRVDFRPDGWQSRVLDSIDADESVFVVAPTSAGKTFISFYAMRKVLQADDEGVLVYVAPTKALVNQIAAEIQARYSKSFKHGGKSVWAIHTRDYRINNPSGCQVLVTVPHILQIMLLAPSNARSWSNRVKRIIFDEVHSIGQAEDGVIWEQLLLMAPCPIIALSATVGNPGEFSQWLTSTQAAMGHKLNMVQHPYRYSDLRKYYFVPPKQFSFGGLSSRTLLNELGLEGLPSLNFIHPVAALVDRSRGIPEDLALEPRDCYLLWQAMIKVQNKDYPVPNKLDPRQILPNISRKVDVLKWEHELKATLKDWIEDMSSPYMQLVHELEKSFVNENREDLYATRQDHSSLEKKVLDEEDFIGSTLSLLSRLHERDALPAILFNYDRTQCEQICQAIVGQLKEAEISQVKSGPKWEKKLEQWEEWKSQKEKLLAKGSKATAKKSKKKGNDDDGDGGERDDEKVSKLDMQRVGGAADYDKWNAFNPESPIDGYHFADLSKAQLSELEKYSGQLRKREVQEWLIEALARGIGVHHAGMNRKYRQVVEILFRKRFLRVVVATGTLALGINMPCKTVIFAGDSVFLTALNYRQCAGRAGRRGFDLLGNVVFHGVSRQKVSRLISSRLPDLNGHFPITTTLVLRLFTLLHESNNSKYAVDAINSLLSQPRLYMGGESFKSQTMHHLRFSIEYLRQQELLGSDGAPLNFAGLVSHLYFTENSSFAFHALLKEGYFNELCSGVREKEQETLETLMLVMAHLFKRILCRRADAEYREKVVKPSSSMVFLPPLPAKAAKILHDHNEQTLQVYRTYVRTFVDQHIKIADNKLPLTGMQFGDTEQKLGGAIHSLPATTVRSSFVALSGAGDDFNSIHDLCSTTRSGVFLEEAVIPYMQVFPDDTEVPLNAWLVDFFKHGDVHTLERANGVRRSDIWFHLNDFSLVLATIVTSLLNFMKLKDGSDMDMLDVKGGMDVYEEVQEDNVAIAQDTSDGSSTTSKDTLVETQPQKSTRTVSKKAKVAESWDDEVDEDDENENDGTSDVSDDDTLVEELRAWNVEEGKGLPDVLLAFQKLQGVFDVKFKAMWA
ncbi:hypothetical protein LTR64_007368 [Lithohypha guttulata]|uniref:uncharacterized protein n=1 Tax=Lithohypha guttulata TaxID=1690604 RepID=UPI002DDF49AF|nr:hypothetical protein LTR51_004074 [Lithohypha guttulata]